jgi:hypothetical protein
LTRTGPLSKNIRVLVESIMRHAIYLLVMLFAGCATIPPLTAEAMHVRAITAEEGLSCTFLKNVSYTAKLSGFGKDYEMVHQAGENGLRNAVAQAGGNAYLDIRTDADSLWGRINYSGAAFKCATRESQDLRGMP